MATTFYTHEYEASHGKSPKGYGSWAFRPYDERGDESIVWAQGTYGDAKRIVKQSHPRITEWVALP